VWNYWKGSAISEAIRARRLGSVALPHRAHFIRARLDVELVVGQQIGLNKGEAKKLASLRHVSEPAGRTVAKEEYGLPDPAP
jgi:hypothetical protein